MSKQIEVTLDVDEHDAECLAEDLRVASSEVEEVTVTTATRSYTVEVLDVEES